MKDEQPNQSEQQEVQSFDLDEIRAKYREEREKRLRDDGARQYIEVKGQYSQFIDDPYAEPGFTREPLHDEVEVLVIGGGFGGLTAGARLRQQGVEDIRFIDPASDFGGTWYWNRYPGIACDVESYIYMPLLEEVGYIPKHKYAYGNEIREHSQAIARKFDLYRDVCFQTRVTKLRFDADISRWIVETDRGDRMKAQYVCVALGQLSRPKLPGIPGIEDFEGHSFHASRWDYEYTGGSSEGNLTGLKGKRVGIIGTGATGVQIVPHVGEWADQLYVFQRTPSSVDVKNNPETDPEWAKSLQPGWHKHRRDNFNALVSGIPQEENLVNDGWTDLIGNVVKMFKEGKANDVSPEGIQRLVELADLQKMESIRARVDSIVEDPATAEALKPYYRQFCKRPCIHNDYLPTFNRSNVTLVDTNGKGVDRITKKGVVVAGNEYPIDCLIFASGFEVGTTHTQRWGFEIVGREGQTLTEKWANGTRTLHGMHMHGFPNLFLMSLGQAGNTVSYTHAIDEQATHLAYIVAQAREAGAETVEATLEGEDGWVAKCIERGADAGYLEDCTPGYYNNEGQPRNPQGGPYGGGAGAMEFLKIVEDWRAAGDLEGLEIRKG